MGAHQYMNAKASAGAQTEPTDGGQTDSDEALREFLRKPLNAWHPETRPIALAILGKLSEELNECGAIVSRCIIQGINESHPETGKVNRDELTKEIADVIALINVAVKYFAPGDSVSMETRRTLKEAHIERWIALLQG